MPGAPWRTRSLPEGLSRRSCSSYCTDTGHFGEQLPNDRLDAVGEVDVAGVGGADGVAGDQLDVVEEPSLGDRVDECGAGGSRCLLDRVTDRQQLRGHSGISPG